MAVDTANYNRPCNNCVRDSKKCFPSIFIVILSLLYLSLYFPLSIFSRELGLKSITNFAPKDYEHHSQNFSVLQDKQGFIYIGNRDGLLQFDGVTWELIRVTNDVVMSLAIADDKETIYVGGYNKIGYLNRNPMGEYYYESLMGLLDEKNKDFTKVWTAHCAEQGVYFQSSEYLMLWKPEKQTFEVVAKSEKVGKDDNIPVLAIYSCNGKLFTRRNKTGLMQINGNKLTLVPGGEFFAKKSIWMMAPLDKSNKQILIGSDDGKLFRYSFEGHTPELIFHLN